MKASNYFENSLELSQVSTKLLSFDPFGHSVSDGSLIISIETSAVSKHHEISHQLCFSK